MSKYLDSVFEDGHRYKGGYLDEKMSGYGEYYWPTGDIYKGQWLNN